MFEDHNNSIYEIFLSNKTLTKEQLDELNETHLNTGQSLADTIISSGLIEKTKLLEAVAAYLNYEYVPIPPANIPEEVYRQLRPNLARTYGVVPVEVSDTAITLLAKDPFNNAIIDDLTFTLNKDVTLKVMDPDQVDNLIIQCYGEEDSSIDDLISEISNVDFDENSESDAANMANETPIIRFVNLILQQAIRDKASDIHFEPFEDVFRIRYRIDGALYEMAPPPKSLALPVISRIKVLANLNIAEQRIPQDGRIKMTISGRPVDLRVSTLPTQFGESVVLRVLDKSVVNLDLDKLSMTDELVENIRRLVKLPNGIFIVTGPTGSGKTTTLYSALREVNTVDIKILTSEDPVEYEIDGIMQVQINHQVGLDFARCLRAFLRQDPDKIMVGEIRDLETAQIAVQASLTGHVVLATLHTNDATSAVTRLVDIGVKPFLVSASLRAALAQRLVRKICTNCKSVYAPDPRTLQAIGINEIEASKITFYHGDGCPKCNGIGFKGRMGIFEIFIVNEELQQMIYEGRTLVELRTKARELGMRSMREDGIRKVGGGLTTADEVLKVTMNEA